eukprot:5009594-Pyramimonas_sp.AAC.1
MCPARKPTDLSASQWGGQVVDKVAISTPAPTGSTSGAAATKADVNTAAPARSPAAGEVGKSRRKAPTSQIRTLSDYSICSERSRIGDSINDCENTSAFIRSSRRPRGIIAV